VSYSYPQTFVGRGHRESGLSCGILRIRPAYSAINFCRSSKNLAFSAGINIAPLTNVCQQRVRKTDGKSQPLDASDSEIRQAIKYELSAVLGIREPHCIVIHRWPAALPQYSVDLPEVWQKARDSWCIIPGRILFGNYTGQISLRGMIDSAASLS
jgi:hypothetical protein